jgi:hypothetical protein
MLSFGARCKKPWFSSLWGSLLSVFSLKQARRFSRYSCPSIQVSASLTVLQKVGIFYRPDSHHNQLDLWVTCLIDIRASATEKAIACIALRSHIRSPRSSFDCACSCRSFDPIIAECTKDHRLVSNVFYKSGQVDHTSTAVARCPSFLKCASVSGTLSEHDSRAEAWVKIIRILNFASWSLQDILCS